MKKKDLRRAERPRDDSAHSYRPVPSASTQRPSEAALVIFAKAPIPGQVKTRLCPPLVPDEAATLHGSFVLDVVERSREVAQRGKPPFDRFVACSPAPDHVFFKVLEARHGVGLIPQIGDDLGSRMSHAFQDTFGLGYRSVLVVGTDLPLLPSSIYSQALTLLSTHDVILGPALDGGYYLVGLTRSIPDLFCDIPWSTDQVFSTTVRKSEQLGLRLAQLPPCRDVDTLADLYAIIEEAGLQEGHGVGRKRPGTRHKKTRGSSSTTSRLWPLAQSGLLSTRTAGVLRTLASRLRARTADRPEPVSRDS